MMHLLRAFEAWALPDAPESWWQSAAGMVGLLAFIAGLLFGGLVWGAET